MERQPGAGRPPLPSQDRALARAVRGLARNREMKQVLDGRMERAEAQIISSLLLRGVATLRLGGYQVDLQGEEIRLTRLPSDEFDVIISSSVLSHLTEDAMHAWLVELKKVLITAGHVLHANVLLERQSVKIGFAGGDPLYGLKSQAV